VLLVGAQAPEVTTKDIKKNCPHFEPKGVHEISAKIPTGTNPKKRIGTMGT